MKSNIKLSAGQMKERQSNVWSWFTVQFTAVHSAFLLFFFCFFPLKFNSFHPVIFFSISPSTWYHIFLLLWPQSFYFPFHFISFYATSFISLHIYTYSLEYRVRGPAIRGKGDQYFLSNRGCPLPMFIYFFLSAVNVKCYQSDDISPSVKTLRLTPVHHRSNRVYKPPTKACHRNNERFWFSPN